MRPADKGRKCGKTAAGSPGQFSNAADIGYRDPTPERADARNRKRGAGRPRQIWHSLAASARAESPIVYPPVLP
jgi:hypothetical protein